MTTTPTPLPVDLRGDGVLWAINAHLFGPRGFALAHNADTGEWHLHGDGTSPFDFTGPGDTERLAAFNRLIDAAKAPA